MNSNYDYESDLNRLKEAQKQAAISDLENTRNQALSNLNAEEQKNAQSYNSQRSSANTQNRLSAKNFQEYLAQTGRANSGLSAQAKLQNDNNLNTSINLLNAGESSALADINRRRTDTENTYSSGLASANANIESNYISNLLNERQKAFDREQTRLAQELQEKQYQENIRQFNENMALQDRQYQESIRQFNENMALQRQQLAQRSFNSGSGGGSSSTRRTTNNTTKKTSNNNDVRISAVSSPAKFSSTTASKWYVKNANGLTSKAALDSAIAKGLKNGKITQADANRIYKSYGIG